MKFDVRAEVSTLVFSRPSQAENRSTPHRAISFSARRLAYLLPVTCFLLLRYSQRRAWQRKSPPAASREQ